MFLGLHVVLYRLSGGRVGGKMFGGEVLLLTTLGHRSGKPRSVPVMYFENQGRRYIVASFGGSPAHPAWFKNIEKHPQVDVQVRAHRYKATAEVIEGDERTRVWQQVITEMPQFAGYKTKIGEGGREIPIVHLSERS